MGAAWGWGCFGLWVVVLWFAVACKNGGMVQGSSVKELEIGEIVELEVTGIAHGGVSVARHEGRVVFVSDTLPGERVLARVTETHRKRFARAVTCAVLEPAGQRVEHVWDEASLVRDPVERVGGAEFGHISVSGQRVLKGRVLLDALVKFAGVSARQALLWQGEVGVGELRVLPVGGDSRGLFYRSRVRLHVDVETGLVGPYAARSRRVVRVGSLPLATETLQGMAPLGECFEGVEWVDLVDPAADDARMLVRERGVRRVPGVRDVVFEWAGGRKFRVRAGGFWQVHTHAGGVLHGFVREFTEQLVASGEFVQGAANLDLYGGSGLLADAVVRGGGVGTKISSVEECSSASVDAGDNLQEFIGARAICSRVGSFLAQLVGAGSVVRDRVRRGLVVLDPPRSGAGGDVVGLLGELRPANIVYVACDPVALARDLALLRGCGYEPRLLRAFDFFPHTHHFETVVCLSR